MQYPYYLKKIIVVIISASLLFIISCNDRKISLGYNNSHSSHMLNETTIGNADFTTDIFITQTGKFLTIRQCLLPNSRCDIEIKTHGLKIDTTIFINNSYTVVKTQLKDIDGNGYDELYLFTENLQHEGNVIAFTTNHEKELEVMKVATFKRVGTYNGKDSFYFNRQQLVRTYPIPDGVEKKSRKITYRKFTELYVQQQNSIVLFGKDKNSLN